MKTFLILGLGMVFLMGASGWLFAQPEAIGYTLSDIYYYLAEGTDATWGGHNLEPQSGVRGQRIEGFTKSLDDIYYYMAEAFGQCNLSYDMMAANYEEGSYFFCTDSNYWGVREGTAPWELNEYTCNALSGWHWYTTNGRSACWSKALANGVTWNKGVGNDTDNPGSYTAASGYTLRERMEAAAAGEWYKIVSEVNGTPITSAHNGSAGSSVISVLAIADCVDGTRDLCTGDGCLGSSYSTINTSLRNWAGAAEKSALPYLGDDEGSSGNNDFETACSQSNSNDLPLSCGDGLFYNNRKICGDSSENRSFAAACGISHGPLWNTAARTVGGFFDEWMPEMSGCLMQDSVSTSFSCQGTVFRVVVRPPAE